MSARVSDTAAMIAAMAPRRVAGAWVFATVEAPPPEAVATIREPEGLSVVVPGEGSDPLAMAWITLDVHSALDAVGFIAHLASALAREGMGVNPVAGFYHDHLFVPEDRAEDALRVLRRIAATPV